MTGNVSSGSKILHFCLFIIVVMAIRTSFLIIGMYTCNTSRFWCFSFPFFHHILQPGSFTDDDPSQ